MKKFLIKFAIFCICFVTTAALLLVFNFCIVAPQFTDEYTGGIPDKIEYLKSVNEPKIILVGNSNLAFGINSEMIQKTFERPVVNLGGYGAFGLEFHLRMAKYNINKDDIVIIANSNYNYLNMSDTELAWETIENHNLWELIPEENYDEMIKSLPKYVAKSLFHWITFTGNKTFYDDCYSQKYFNKYGDNVYPRPKNRYTFSVGSVTVPKINNECANALNEFNKYCKQQGASCMIAGHPIPYGKYTAPRNEYIAFQKALIDKVECEIISDYTDYFIEYKYFYDTVNHLTDEGVKIRTNLLINDLKNWLSKQKS